MPREIQKETESLGRRLVRWAGISGMVLFTLLVYSPGFMGFDALQQLEQARQGTISDFHPPLMAFTWRIFVHHLHWLGGLMALHALFYWFGWFSLCFQIFRNPVLGGLLAIAIGLFPPFFAMVGTVWKDVGMGASLLAASALLLNNESNFKWRRFVLSFLLLLYAMGMRHNAFFGVIPLVFWLAHQVSVYYRTKIRTAGVPTVLLGCAGTLVIVLMDLAMQWAMVNSVFIEKHVHRQCLMMYDLAGISLGVNELVFPRYQTQSRSLALDTLKDHYSAENCIHLMSQKFEPTDPLLHFTRDLTEIKNLQSTWANAIATHPISYLRHRWNVFSRMVGLQGIPHYPFHSGIDKNNLGVRFRPSRATLTFGRFHRSLKQSSIFRGWIYILLSFSLLALSVRMFKRGSCFPIAAITVSSLAYLFGLFILTCSADFRYIWWPVLSAVAAILMVIFLSLSRERSAI